MFLCNMEIYRVEVCGGAHTCEGEIKEVIFKSLKVIWPRTYALMA